MEIFNYIFTNIWLPLIMFWLFAILLSYLGYPKLINSILDFLDFKEKIRLKRLKKRYYITKNGSADDIVKLLNKENKDSKIASEYQYLTDSELKEKYKGLDFNKVEIVFQPHFLYNVDTELINDHVNELHFLDEDGNIKNNIEVPPVPEGNRNVSVFNYKFSESELFNEIKKLNNCKKIAIYRHKTDMYRYRVLDNVK